MMGVTRLAVTRRACLRTNRIQALELERTTPRGRPVPYVNKTVDDELRSLVWFLWISTGAENNIETVRGHHEVS